MVAEFRNRVIQIPDSQIEVYAAKGYTIKNDEGTVVKPAVPNDFNMVNAELAKVKEENAKIKEENTKLLEQIKSLETEIAELKAVKPEEKKPRKSRLME